METDKREHRRGGARLQHTASGPSRKEPGKPRKNRSKGPKKPWKQLRTQEKVLRVLLIVAAVLAAVLLAAFLFLHFFIQKPTLPTEPKVPMPQESGELLATDRPGRTSADRKEDFFTFLVIGRDTGGGGNTDTLMLAAYDVPNQKLNVMSIPRDTMVNVPWDIKKINSVYNFYGGGDEGIQALYKEISQLVGFVPDYEVIVEWEAVGELVDALGGVYFDVPIDMNYDDPTQDLHIHINKGYQKLNGEQAMGVVRYRHDNMVNGKMKGYPNGDLGRIETQQAFLTAVVEQCLQIQNVTRINELAKVFTKNVTTDLTVNNLAWFAQQAIFGGLQMENVNFCTMPNQGEMVWSRSYHNYQSYVTPIEDELVDLVNECFNPYKEDLDPSELDIMSVDDNGRLHSTTGRVEDTKANSSGGGSSSSSSQSGSSTSKPSSTPKPSATPKPEVTATPTTKPSETPTESAQPSQPVESATPAPSTPVETTTPAPSAEPTPAPTAAPTAAPTGPPADGGGEVVLPPEAVS